MTTQNKADSWEKRVVKVSRVSKVVKGGKKISFRATVVVGDMEYQVGVGVGKAEEVSTAIKKAETDARKNVIIVPIAEGKTIPHATVGVECGIVLPSAIEIVMTFFFASVSAFFIAVLTSSALPTPTPTCCSISPTTTVARKLIFLPPFTTLETRETFTTLFSQLSALF